MEREEVSGHDLFPSLRSNNIKEKMAVTHLGLGGLKHGGEVYFVYINEASFRLSRFHSKSQVPGRHQDTSKDEDSSGEYLRN